MSTDLDRAVNAVAHHFRKLGATAPHVAIRGKLGSGAILYGFTVNRSFEFYVERHIARGVITKHITAAPLWARVTFLEGAETALQLWEHARTHQLRAEGAPAIELATRAGIKFARDHAGTFPLPEDVNPFLEDGRYE